MVCPRRRLCTSRYPGKRRGKRSCSLASSLDYMWAVSLPNRPGKMKITLLSNKDTVVLRIIRNYLSWDVPANFFRHSGRLLCTDWNLDLSALIRCHLFLKDFQQLLADHPSRPPYGQPDRKNTTFHKYNFTIRNVLPSARMPV